MNEVHVWSAALVTESVDLACLEQTLAPEERARAARFHSLKERNRFVVCRSLLREILGRYLDRNPGDLRFANGLYGKPFLLDAAGPPEIRFNMTRSRDLALLAFARNREVGIDVEWINPDFADLQVAELFFSPREFSALCATPASLQVGAFFDCWTRKEAYVKACGEGLFKGLGSFDVLQASGEPAALLSNGGTRWSLHALAPEPGYMAAIAVEGTACPLRLWNIEGHDGESEQNLLRGAGYASSAN